MTFAIHVGDCLDVLPLLAADSVHACVTDPPYALTANKKGGSGEASLNLNSPAGRSRISTGGGFMGKAWDSAIPGPEYWLEVFRVLKPGAHLVAFGGTRTFHRLACAIEDAGFEIRDCLGWLYGSGFPKSLDVSKAMDRAADYEIEAAVRRAAVEAVEAAGLVLPGNSRWDWTVGEHAPGAKWWKQFQEWLPSLSASDRDRVEGEIVERVRKKAGWFTSRDIYDVRAPASDDARRWQGWGTALKPAWEPIILARKPLSGTVAANALEHGTGALNIDGCRIGDEPGRWPANIAHDGSEEVLAVFPDTPGQLADASSSSSRKTQNVYGDMKRGNGRDGEPSADSENAGSVGFKMRPGARRGDEGSAARFFYCAKASREDRNEGTHGMPTKVGGMVSNTSGQHMTRRDGGAPGPRENHHPTVKPTDLMRWLCRLVTPKGGTVLDPFMGSGSTGKAADIEGFDFVGIELDPEYAEIARARIAGTAPLFAQEGT